MSQLLRFATDAPRLTLRTVVGPIFGSAPSSSPAQDSGDERQGRDRAKSRRMTTAAQLDRVEL
jgi:hypothetical protein